MFDLTRIAYILLVVGLLSSCREDFALPEVDAEQEINFVSQLSPDAQVSAHIYKSLNFDTNSSTDIDDVTVLFSGTDLPSKQTAMVYSPDSEAFILRKFDFRPSPGNTYEILAYTSDPAIDTVTARTYIPTPVSLTGATVENFEMKKVGTSLADYRIRLSMTIGRPRVRPAYFHIMPKRKLSTFRQSEDGNILVTNTNESVSLKIVDIVTGRNGIYQFVQEDGVFVDYSRIEDNSITLEIETAEPIDIEEEIFKLLDIEIHTLSEELYLYQQSLHKQIINSKGSFGTPTSTYSNVHNGFGVLGAYSSKTTSLEIPN